MKKHILLFIACGTLLFSCNNESIDEVRNSAENKVVDNKVIENVIYRGKSKYAEVFKQYPLVGYSSNKANALAREELSVFDGSRNDLKTKSSLGFKVLVNGRDLSGIDLQTKSDDAFSDLYGREVVFAFSPIETKGAGRAEAKTVSMYIPELVSITSPKIEREAELYPYCYYKNFLLRWNEDSKNENGLVVVIVEWFGMVFPGEVKSEYVRNIDVLPEDDGAEVLNNKLFDNIPENALCYITLLRGNIENVDFNDIPYSAVGETHEVLPMILVKNLKR